MDIREVARMMKEAVLKSEMKWEGVDLLECARYVALNWDEVTCRKSKLRRILPTRRSKQGTKPGVRGKGPMGKVRGDCEQWKFPPVTLEEWEKKEMVATVVEIATITMFNQHYYDFAGKT